LFYWEKSTVVAIITEKSYRELLHENQLHSYIAPLRLGLRVRHYFTGHAQSGADLFILQNLAN